MSYEPPPAGTPDTPYWYTIGDSLFWYLPADSQGVVQMTSESTPDERSAALFLVRDLGWRMSVQRTGLSRPTDAQELSQANFAVDRVDLAASMIDNYGAFRESFWSGSDTTLLGLLPGLRQSGSGPPQCFWPSTFAVVWKPGTREVDTRAIVDSLGFKVLMPLTLAQNYWVERAWTVQLPAGVELFTWLRWFNRHPLVHLAHPVLTSRDLPTSDFRIVRRFPLPPDRLIPPGVEKFTPLLKTCWDIATFCGHTDFVEDNLGAAAEAGRLRVLFKWSGDYDLSTEIKSAGGDVLASKQNTMEAWVPYDKLAALAAASSVTSVEEVRANYLGK